MVKKVKIPVVKDYKDLKYFTDKYKDLLKDTDWILEYDFNYSYFSMSDIKEAIERLLDSVEYNYYCGKPDIAGKRLKVINKLTKLAIKFNKHFGT